ncbi:MAG: non-ribosomal peptide synthetase, partial [bacterium]|nr:non-ribosomal peptide synthetase [bacterium]
QGKQEAVIEEFTRDDRERGFDLARDILMRAVLFKTGLNTYSLVWSFHHILMDGWCLGIIYRELVRLYRRLQQGKTGTHELEPVTPYIKYIHWLGKQDQEEGLNYWQQYLEGYDLQAGLPRLETVDPVKEETYKPGEYTPEIDQKETGDLNKIARENQVTLNTVLQTLWGILLQKYNNTNDVVFGVVVSGRTAGVQGIENMVGLFINTIPLRITTGEQDSLLELLKRIHRGAVASRPFEYLSLAKVQMISSLKGDLIHHIMVFQDYPLDKEMKTESMKPGNDFCLEDIRVREQNNYNFNIMIVPGESFRVKFQYNLQVYGNAFIKNIGRHFKQVIRQVLQNPSKPVKEIDILTPAEKHQVLFDFNRTEAGYPKNKTLHRLIDE